ncbi:hydrophobin [Trichoderma velutinum]
MYASIILYTIVALGGVMASPAQEPGVEPRAIERRVPTMADIPFPRFPTRNYNHNDGKGKDGKGGKGGKDDHDHGKGGKDGHDGKGGKDDHDGKGCSSDTNTQLNACNGGNPYCCSSNGKGGHACKNTTACQETIICCNNNNGFQICIGDLDFNVPITINIYEDDD